MYMIGASNTVRYQSGGRVDWITITLQTCHRVWKTNALTGKAPKRVMTQWVATTMSTRADKNFHPELEGWESHGAEPKGT